jgi:tripartite ATP-independent transporter DctM subunit
MGELFFHTGVAGRVFDVLDHLLGRISARLSFVTIAGGTLFSALSGSSVANIAMMGSTMYPEMKRRGYSKYLSVGPIVATGGLAAIIPPSGLAVLLGSLAGLDVGSLLLAGIAPGLLLAFLYASLAAGWVRFSPGSAMSYEVEAVSAAEKIKMAVSTLLPIGLVIFSVVGVIILGIATPTESGAFGVVGVICVAAVFRRLSVRAIRDAISGTLKVTGMIFLIILASTTFSQVLAISGASSGLIQWVVGLKTDPIIVLAGMGLILLVLGAFMESVAIMMLTVPIFFPLIKLLGVDSIWFGVFMLMLLEIGLITPPFGLGLFVMSGTVGKDLTVWDVSKAVMPYLACTLTVVAVLALFPQIVTYLPSVFGR